MENREWKLRLIFGFASLPLRAGAPRSLQFQNIVRRQGSARREEWNVREMLRVICNFPGYRVLEKSLAPLSFLFVKQATAVPTVFVCSKRLNSSNKMSCKDFCGRLTAEQYRITQEKGTERAFTGKYYDHHDKGTYICICCKTPLFSSETKYDSGSGWPSFYKTLKEGNAETVKRIPDHSHKMVRVEVTCHKCDAHLGHVFDDGPAPTFERFCINSASLDFVGTDK